MKIQQLGKGSKGRHRAFGLELHKARWPVTAACVWADVTNGLTLVVKSPRQFVVKHMTGGSFLVLGIVPVLRCFPSVP